MVLINEQRTSKRLNSVPRRAHLRTEVRPTVAVASQKGEDMSIAEIEDAFAMISQLLRETAPKCCVECGA